MGKRFAVIGASGFVGRAVVEAALREGHEVDRVRLRIDPDSRVNCHPSKWSEYFSEAYAGLAHSLAKADIVVNAAGMADSQSTPSFRLRAANVVLPALAAQAVQQARSSRLVHVSSAAVQGRRDPLDEEPTWQPFSPYSWSKAEAERLLLQAVEDHSAKIVIYRATSVHGPGRPVTKRFSQIAHRRAVPVCRRGAAPLPVALWSNVGAGIVHAATASRIARIVLQPSEGMTAADLWKAFNPEAHMLNLPVPAVRSGLAGLRVAGRLHPPLAASARRLEVLLLGQRVQAVNLHESRFRPPAEADAWRELGRIVSSPSQQVLNE